jgi:hypothetical protein
MGRFLLAIALAYAAAVGGLAGGVVASREGAQFDHHRNLYSVAGIVLLVAALVLAMMAASMVEVA